MEGLLVHPALLWPPFLVAGLVVALILTSYDPEFLFFVGEALHAGAVALLLRQHLAAGFPGLSLVMQQLTAIFLTGRIVASCALEVDWAQVWLSPAGATSTSSSSFPPLFSLLRPALVHLVLDACSLVSTLFVVYRMQTMPRPSHDTDRVPLLFVLVPAVALALVFHPPASGAPSLVSWSMRVCWAASLYVEALSNLPQLVLFQAHAAGAETGLGPEYLHHQMQQPQEQPNVVRMVGADYVFLLAMSRYVMFLYWMALFLDPFQDGHVLGWTLMQGHVWTACAFVAEVVQCVILADFSALYIQALAERRGRPAHKASEP